MEMTAVEAIASLNATRTSHRWAAPPGNFDRMNLRALYPSDNQWGIPNLPAALEEPSRLVRFHDNREMDKAYWPAAVHFFLDDYRFETMWTQPQRSLARVQRVGAALTPDFSLWREMPRAMQIWQTYRNRWCGCWMAEHGVKVIPTVGWSTADSFDFCFEGIAPKSVVAVSTVGVTDSLAKELFAAGYKEMCARLEPARVLIYGRAPEIHVLGDTPFRCYPTRWDKP